MPVTVPRPRGQDQPPRRPAGHQNPAAPTQPEFRLRGIGLWRSCRSPGPYQAALFAWLLLHSDQEYRLTELAKRLDLPLATLQREVQRFVGAGILQDRTPAEQGSPGDPRQPSRSPVSYTHLTLPTNREV